MPPKVSEYIKDEAIRDGNCGLNALSLALAKAKSFEEINSQIKHQGLSVNSNLSTLNKENLQKELAPILRELHYRLAKDNAEHLECTQQPLLSAFRDFAEDTLGLQVKQNDDIFVKYFRDQFASFALKLKKANLQIDTYKQLKNKQDKTDDDLEKLKKLTAELNRHFELTQKKLLSWWQSSGYDQFQKKLRQNGEYVGDLELSLLAKYFNVNLNAYRGETINHSVYFDHGIIPIANAHFQLSKEDINQLVVRGVVDKPAENANELRLLKLDESYQARLAAVPEFDKVKDYVTQHVDNFDHTVVPDTWSSECLTELKKRNVVEEQRLKNVDGSSLTVSLFKVTGDIALQRIEAIKDKEQIIATIESNRKELPVITLVNENEHWDNVVLKINSEVAVEVISANQIEQQSEPEITAEIETKEVVTDAAVETPLLIEEVPPVVEHANKVEAETPEKTKPSHDVQEKTLEKLNKGEIKFNQTKWDQLLNEVSKYESPSSPKQSSVEPKSASTKTLVSYFFKEKSKEIDIDTDLQIKLDEQLATQLQEEEYQKLKC